MGIQTEILTPDLSLVREHLARVLASPQFAGSARLSRFLEYCVDSTLEDRGRLKEYDIALEVFDRDSNFDPRIDPIVRVQASRLRAKLKEYYHESTKLESFRIVLPKGGYAVAFELISPVTPASADTNLVDPKIPEALPDVQPVASPRPRHRRLVYAAVGIATLGLIALAIYARNPRSASAARRSVAVVYFKNLSGSAASDWLATALSEMLTAELGSSSQIRMIPGENVARMKTELALPEVDGFDRETLQRIRRNLGSDLVLAGSYLPVGGKIRVDIRLQEAESGETIESVTRTDYESNLLPLVSAVGGRIRNKLGVALPTSGEESVFRASSPSNAEAVRLYSEGLRQLERFDALGARATLEQAIAADPAYPLSHASLSMAWSRLGYYSKAAAEAAAALKLSGSLSREERLLVEGRSDEANSQWPKAVEVYQALWSFFPDRIDYGLLLTNAQTEAGQPKKALATVDALRKTVPGGDARVDLAESKAADGMADNNRAAAAAEHAEQFARISDARLLEANASIAKGNALTHLTQPDKAVAAFENAIAICHAVSDPGCVASAQNNEAALLRTRGNLDGSGQLLETALDTATKIGDRRTAIRILTNMGHLARSRADLPAAGKYFDQALASSRETGDLRYVAIEMNNLGNIANNTGQAVLARTRYEESLSAARAIDDRSSVSVALGNIAILDYSEGRLTEARRGLEEALVLKRDLGDRASYAYSLKHLSNVLRLQGELAQARKVMTEQCAIYSAANERIAAAECTLGLADLDLHEGHPDLALTAALKIAGEFTTVSPATEAWRVAALSYLNLGKSADARTAIDKSLAIAQKSANAVDFRIPSAVTKARIDAASGNTGAALASLRENLVTAQKLNKSGLQFNIRLMMLRLQNSSGAEVAKFEDEARRAGYGLYADEAKALRTSKR